MRVAGETHNVAANPRMAVCMRCRTDCKACAHANYGQLKIYKKSQNFSLLQLFIEAYKSRECVVKVEGEKISIQTIAQLAGAVEYTDCTSAEG